MAQTKPQETRPEACGILFVIETNPDQTTAEYIHRKRFYTFEFLLRQPEDYFETWRWMKSCNALQGALSDFLQTVNTFVIFFIVNKSSSYQTTTKQTHFQNFKVTNGSN